MSSVSFGLHAASLLTSQTACTLRASQQLAAPSLHTPLFLRITSPMLQALDANIAANLEGQDGNDAGPVYNLQFGKTLAYGAVIAFMGLFLVLQLRKVWLWADWSCSTCCCTSWLCIM